MVRVGVNYNLTLINANTTRNRLAHSEALLPLATGRRINKLRDDPSVLVEFFNLSAELKSKEKYDFNINTARSRINVTDAVLEEINNLIVSAYEAGIQGANDGLNADDISVLVSRLNDIDADVLSLANSKIGDVYLFSGFQSTTQPFDGSAGTFNGDTNDVRIKVTDTTQVTVSVNGDDLFTGGSGNVDIFDTIDNLITAIQARDSDDINTEIANLQTIMANMQVARGEMGNALSQLDTAEEFLSKFEVTNSERMGVIRDADLAEAATKLSYQEFALEASYAVSRRVLDISLTSFLS